MSWLIHSSTFQSTLPRGERPNFGNSHRSTFNFNPRSREGSDPVCTLPPCPPGISIHAPARGATGSLRHISLGHRDFNPRSREGSDDFLFATCYSINYFNPRSREGSDDGNEKKIAVDDLFQSTLPRGERRESTSGMDQHRKFQSTLPRGERRGRRGNV